MSNTRPSIVVVPGAHHVPEHFQSVTDLLEKDGYKVTGVRLPSPDDSSLPPGYEGELATIRSAIHGEIHQGHDVLLVVHSASGSTGPAAMQGLAKKSDEPGVIGILGISAILTPPGQTGGQLLAGKSCQWRELKNDQWVVLPYDEPGEAPTGPGTARCSPFVALYNDMTAEQSHKAYDMLVPTYGDTLSVPGSYAGWQDVPLTYVICEKDQALLPEVQEELIRNANIDIKLRRLDASHTPFISMPDKVFGLIKEAAGAI